MLLSEVTGKNPIKPNAHCHKKLYEIHKAGEFNLNYELALPACFCGIEIEVEGVEEALPISSYIWQAKEDNSLRNHGIEYISYPIAGKDIVRALELFYKHLPGDAQFSPRTSIHVHVNVLDMTVEEAKRFLVLYLLFEKVLYRFVGRDRDHNIFCVPLQDSYRVKSILTNFVDSLSVQRRVEYEERRYAGLNLACIYKFGTFEFRQLGGTRNLDLILGWINLLLLLKKHACLYEEDTLLNSIFALNTNSDYHTFLYKIFESESQRFNMQTVNQDMERGVYVVKHAWLQHNFEGQVRLAFHRDSPAYKFHIENRHPKRKSMMEDVIIEQQQGFVLDANAERLQAAVAAIQARR